MPLYTYRHHIHRLTDDALTVADQILTEAWARVYFLGPYSVEQRLLNFRMPFSQGRLEREEELYYGCGIGFYGERMQELQKGQGRIHE